MQRPVQRLTVGLTAAALMAVGIAVPATAAVAAEEPTDLIISEYVEGTSFNKAVELYNPTEADIPLTGYSLEVYFNGSATATTAGTFALTGTVAAGDAFVFADEDLVAFADQITANNLWNGDDAIVLKHDGAVVDSLGQVGFDPGSEWGTGLTSTLDNTIRRNANVCVGDTIVNDVFDPSAEWTGYATNTFDGLGSHTVDCDGTPPPPPVADCDAEIVAIGAVQGSGSASPLIGSSVEIEGVVIGDFQVGGFNGYYVQDGGDGDPATSDGVFVYAPGGAAVDEGDLVHVVGTVSEFNGLTEITATVVSTCDTGLALPPAAEVTLPWDDATYEALEGMRVTLPQELSIIEYFNFDRFGEIVLGTERQMQPTAVYEPGSPEATQLAADNLVNRITLDDARSVQNPDPAIHPNGAEFTLENRFRGGDHVTDVTGVLDYRFGLWRVQPTLGADYTAVNPRTDVPDVGGNFTVASFNVLNYFTTLGSRGAATPEEFERQESKIVSAISAIDADVFGLIEIENNGDDEVSALDTLVAALNEKLGAEVYAAVDTGVIGTDEITTAFIYKPSEVELAGVFKILDESVDARFNTDLNRPALAQTFADVETGEEVTVVVNHFKSKGSDCNDVGDPDTGDGQGNCNLTRTAAAEALADWLATGPTGAEAGRELIIGDLNSYDKEDPIQALVNDGYTDLLLQEQGENAYSYVFDGQLGYLDYGLVGSGLAGEVTGASTWSVNADEPDLLDYLMGFKQDAQDAIFAPDAYRSSDHDPVIVGFDFIAPELSVTVDPEVVFPPNAKWRTVTFDIEATDDSGEVEVELVEATAEGHKAQVEVISDTEARVLARQGAVYTFVFEATDPSGNTTTQEVTVTVGP
ncbi:ExeM/NucH family extracellular endonuclease [Agromyces bracchium]|uniref:ExeM/NucH family extracellular endonuclease n=1 Tax=Agromyces bracchium TaxID=88376 RepID=A0A6I3M488_9MICO|nr:ExeM/NucH family extracellular endonuclease [Agromyces bracchium]MTH66947.1 ExeM/NucH family extracellular endonuclease [Agromyces bracchium]